MANDKIFQMDFANIYDLYIQKVERKGHSKEELETVTMWLTGYSKEELKKQLDNHVTVEEFYTFAPEINPHAKFIKGSICGVHVDRIEDPLMQKVRYLDKLVDELAKGKKLEKILRKPE
ncbi:hypothetical protein A4S06_04605 [Erysipelotrichaceae bacterium MTC7]|nr:hypothetical protein A4S06_04605 [Erysipelotrichaceae bacterium MTC7]